MRNRLLVGVVVGSVAVLAAGAPGLVNTSGELTDAQERVDLARLNRDATALAHALADERQAVLAYRASDGTSPEDGLTSTQRALVDRQVEGLRADAPARLRALVDSLPELRQRSLSDASDALTAHREYTEAIQELNGVAAEAARALPASATDRTAEALPSLVRAVEQAAAARDLLVVALARDESHPIRPQAVASAQLADVRQRAAVADFRQIAAADARDSYTETVAGPEVDAAEHYLERLNDPSWSAGALDHQRVEGALSARIDLMRGVTSALAVGEVERLEGLRDDAVTDLEIQVALLGALLLLALGSGVYTARSMARPLAVLRRGARRVAADPAGEEPVRFTGRDDEFADVVRAVNELRQAAATSRQRADADGEDRDRLAGSRDRLAVERAELAREYEALRQRLAVARPPSDGGYAHLALRSLELVERQLAVLDRPFTGPADRERAALDQLAARIRRHCQNLLVLAGGVPPAVEGALPEPLAEVVRAAIRGVEDGERVTVGDLPVEVRVVGSAARDLGRALAELLDNAVSFSTHDRTVVEVSGRPVDDGLLLSVLDHGIGMTLGRMEELNAGLEDPGRLSPPAPDASDTLRMGLYAVARLAARHGFEVRLSARREGGIAAEVRLTSALLVTSAPVPSRSTATDPAQAGLGQADPAGTDPVPAGPVPADPVSAADAATEATAVTPAVRPAAGEDPARQPGVGSPVDGAEHSGARLAEDEVRGPVTGPWWGGDAPLAAPHPAQPVAADGPETAGGADGPVSRVGGADDGLRERPAADEPVRGGTGGAVTEGPADAEGGTGDPLGGDRSSPGAGSGPRSGPSFPPAGGRVPHAGAVPPRTSRSDGTPSPAARSHRRRSSRLALTDDPLVEAARRAEREAASGPEGSGAAPTPAARPLTAQPSSTTQTPAAGTPVVSPPAPGEGRSQGVASGAQPSDPPSEEAPQDASEQSATGADALMRAAGPYLIGPEEHVRSAPDGGHPDPDQTPDQSPDQSPDPESVRPGVGASAEGPGGAVTTAPEDELPERHSAPPHRPSATPSLPVRPLPQRPTPEPAGARKPPRVISTPSTAPTVPPAQAASSDQQPRTAVGLPQRTPRPPADPGLPPPRPQGRLDPEELRRRLGGFQRGAWEGRRDAESDVAGGRSRASDRPSVPEGGRGAAAPPEPGAGRDLGRDEPEPRPGAGHRV